MKKEGNKTMSVLVVLLVFSVILNVVFFFFLQGSKWTTSSTDVTELETVIDEQKIEIESLKLMLEQAEENVQTESEDVSESGSGSDLGEPPITADNKSDSDSIGENTTGYTETAEAFLEALLTYISDDMDSRNELLKAVISGSEITAKLITSGASTDTETDGASGNTSWQTDYSSKLEDSQIYVSISDNKTVVNALADATYTLTDEFGNMSMSAYISVELEQNGQGEYKVTGYEIMSKN